ncbi:MAG: hypothetical protein ACRD29_22750 [Acidimicrobiales bacterium]
MNPVSFAQRRIAGSYTVDPWGLDTDLVELLSPLAGVRWSIEVDGGYHVPGHGPVVVVFNRRWGLSEPLVVARALRLATGRWVRVVGIPDVAPVGPLLSRLGAAVDAPAEVAGLLRSGEVVAVPLGRQPGMRRRAGRLAPALVELAVQHGAPVLPVVAVGHELGRRWRVVVGPVVAAPVEDTVAPFVTAELIDRVRVAVQDLLDGTRPPRRRPW